MIASNPSRTLIFVTCTLLFLSACTTEPTIPQGPNVEMSFDGLTRVDNSLMDYAWVKQGLSIKNYHKILPVSAGIEYRAVKPVSRLSAKYGSTNEFPLDEDQKTRIAKTISDVFETELVKMENFTVTDKPAPDTLLIIGSLIDVVSNVPPEPMGRTKIYLTHLGAATLVIEIRDSQSGEILARAIDSRTIDARTLGLSNVVTNTNELRIFARHWASLIRKRLDEFHAL
jgi:hypothetical protein